MPELRPDYTGVACAATLATRSRQHLAYASVPEHTVWPGHLAPDDPDLGSSYLLLAAVYICDALAGVESRSFLVVDALDLDERGVRVRVALASLVRQMSAYGRGLVCAFDMPTSRRRRKWRYVRRLVNAPLTYSLWPAPAFAVSAPIVYVCVGCRRRRECGVVSQNCRYGVACKVMDLRMWAFLAEVGLDALRLME